jgi:flagellar basal-body rod protein FlgC
MADERFLTHFDTSASALTTERLKMRLIANNMANLNTTRTPEGGPYKRVEALVTSKRLNDDSYENGVGVQSIHVDNSDPRLVFDPQHPDANQYGYVAYPNVDLITETTDLKQASLAYEANATMIETLRKTINIALELGVS